MDNKIIKFFIGFCLFTLLSNEILAQIGVNNSRTQEEQLYYEKLNKKWKEAIGTFQIQVVNSRINPQVGVEIIEKVEEARKDDQIVYIPLREHVRIMILPKNEINNKDFKKIPHFQYISE